MAWRRGQTYAQDLRERVLAARDLTSRQAAERFGVGVSSAIRWVAQARATGDLEPRRRGGCRPSRIDGHADLIMDWIGAEPDLTLAEIRRLLRRQGNGTSLRRA